MMDTTRRLMKRRLRRRAPALVWFLVLITTVALYVRQNTGIAVMGFAAETRYGVAPETAGRLQQLDVELDQNVSRGQIVAVVSNEDLLLQLREARLERERLAQELGREKALWDLDAAGLQVDQQTNLRRFARDVENTHFAYLDALADLAEGRVRLQGLELTFSRTKQLEVDGLTATATLDEDRVAFHALETWIDEQETRVDAMHAAYQESDARYRTFRDEFVTRLPDAGLLLDPLENAMKAQGVRIEMVNLAISGRVLRAPADGKVAEIFHQAGDVVSAGEPVLTIVEARATEVVAYLPEHRVLDVEPGTPVKIRRLADRHVVIESPVASLGSRVEPVPARLEPGAMIPSYGRAVHITLADSLAAVPGESFEVFF